MPCTALTEFIEHARNPVTSGISGAALTLTVEKAARWACNPQIVFLHGSVTHYTDKNLGPDPIWWTV
jgi:hypothetical protein